jgi:hypothetical protein
MEKKLYKGVLIFIGFILLIAVAFPAKKKIYDLNDVSFEAKQSTTLYFKNTRAFYYAMAENQEAGFDVYRYGKCLKDDSVAYLNFILIHNWRGDEAYVFTEPSKALLEKGPIQVTVGDTTWIYDKTTMNNEAQYQFAAATFTALMAEKPVQINNDQTNLFGTKENQKANLTVLEDYFKWVYKYR